MHFIRDHWNKPFHFSGKFDFLVKTITDSVRLRVVYVNLVLTTANGIMFCETDLQSAAHDDMTTIHDLFKIYFISSFCTDPRSFSSKPRSFVHKIVLSFDH